MAYKKNYKRRRYGRRPYRKPKRYQVADMAYSAYKTARKVAAMVNVEYKHFDVAYSAGIPANSAGSLQTINAIPQGDTDSSRDGDSLKVINCNVDGYIVRQGQDDLIRVMYIWSKQNSITGLDDILQYGASSPLAVESPKNYDTRFESKVLFDRKFVVDANNPIKRFSAKLPIHLHTQFSAGTTTINTGALLQVIVGTAPTSGSDPLVHLVNRVTYTDN